MIFHLASIVFVILKVTGYIAWSWWLVFAPSIFIAILVLCVIVISMGLD